MLLSVQNDTQARCHVPPVLGNNVRAFRYATPMNVGVDTVKRSLKALAYQGLITIERGRRARVRITPPREAVALHVGDEAISRMPTPAEVSLLSLATGVPVIEIRRSGALSPELRPADAIQLRAAPPGAAGQPG